MWHIKVPASSANLGSGLDTLGMALDLWLELWFTPARDLTIEVHGEGRGQLSEDETNLVWQTAEALYRHKTHAPMPRGHLIASSQIPLGRGLGSSASAVVAGLMLANVCLDGAMTHRELLKWAVEIEGHPDNVAASLYGGLVMSWPDGERVMATQYAPPELDAVLVIPDYEVPTEKARAILPDRVPRADAIFNAQRVGLWIDALWRRDWSLLQAAGQDRLHQPYRQVLIRGMDALITSALEAGAAIATLSGSGPTILALTDPTRTPAVSLALQHTLNRIPGLNARIQTVAPSHAGAEGRLEDIRLEHGC